MECMAAYCRYPSSHMTSAHRCGKCKSFGHGEAECGSWAKRRDLAVRAAGQRAPPSNLCTVVGCQSPRTHTTNAHHCPVCRERHDGSHICPITSVTVAQASQEQRRAIDELHLHAPNRPLYSLYICIDGSEVIRYHSVGVFDVLRTDSECGQTVLPWFIYNREEVELSSLSPAPAADREKCCPVCRAEVPDENGLIALYGATLLDKCSVCLDKNVSHVFTKCGHAVVCEECAQRWLPSPP